jgi:ABC-type uncharacterized transport system permease subunit
LNWAIPLLSLIAALALGAIVLRITGKNPIDVYQRIFERGFAGKRVFSDSLVRRRGFSYGTHQRRW